MQLVPNSYTQSNCRPPADFCINSYFLKDLLGLDSIDSCICSPDSIAEISQLANDAQGDSQQVSAGATARMAHHLHAAHLGACLAACLPVLLLGWP